MANIVIFGNQIECENGLSTEGRLIKEAVTLGVSGDGESWFCAFCGNHGSEKIHYDDCFTQRPEIKKIMEAK
jgi:hypothetical protein